MFVLLLTACAPDADHDDVSPPEDCDDADASVSPNAVERCNGRDDDCDGRTDEDGALGGTTWYADADADGHPAALAERRTACAAPTGFGAAPDAGFEDCDDADATVWWGAPELSDGHDNDCDGRTDETPFDEGRVYLTEIARQPRFGQESVVVAGQWFEVSNTAGRDVDLAGAWVVRTNAEVGTDQFQIDPSPLIVAAGTSVVLCKTDLGGTPFATGLQLHCAYQWGDPLRPDAWVGAHRDNTFNLQRDTDSLAIYLDDGGRRGRLVDRVAWTFGTGSDWPRLAAHSLMLDPSVGAADNGTAANDDVGRWCSAPASGARWWTGSGAEFGTPGAANPVCGVKGQ